MYHNEYNYLNFLKDKNVILVGSAHYLIGKNLGNWINSFDLIIRMNLSCPIKEDLKIDIGSRTDILYHTLIYDKFIKARPDLFKPHTKEEMNSWKNDGVKWVVTHWDKNNTRVKNFEPIINGIINWTDFPQKKYSCMKRELKSVPNIGTVVMSHVLDSDVKSLSVVGCDFHRTGYYPGYGGFTKEEAQKGTDSVAIWGQVAQPKESAHKIEPQLKFINELSKRDNRLILDHVLKNILKEAEENNYTDFKKNKTNMVTAIIPMKEYSERVPNKNIRDFNGKPLFYWIINSLSNCKYIKEIVIDTDSKNIANKVQEYFKDIKIIMRPKHLHGDMVTGNAIIENDLNQLEGDYFLYTHTTNPLLKSETIDLAIEEYFNNIKTNDSLFSVTKHQIRLLDKECKPINHGVNNLIRTQDLEPVFEDNSNIYIFSKESFAKNGRIGLNPKMFEINKLEAVDIDEEEDFILAEIIKKHHKQNKIKKINTQKVKNQDTLENYVKDKNIVLVGSAGYLQNKNKGEWIDEFDVVVKLNHAIGVLPQEDYGERSDILYHVLLKDLHSKNGKKNIDLYDIKNWQNNDVKYLVSRYPYGSKKVKDFQKINKDTIRVECINREFSKSVKCQIKSKTPNTGVLAISHLLSLPIKSLTVVGFDFYNSGVADNYDGFKNGKDAVGINEKRHDSKAQLEYLKKIYTEQNGRLILDDALLRQF